jgi:alpha-galactosidase/6-phospho-beta-glucosidase family protein
MKQGLKIVIIGAGSSYTPELTVNPAFKPFRAQQRMLTMDLFNNRDKQG